MSNRGEAISPRKRRRSRSLRSTPETNRLVMDNDQRQALCHLQGIVNVYPARPTYSYEMALAIRLAIEHLQTGNGSLVPEIQNIDQTCPIRFTTSIADDRWDPSHAFALVDELTDESTIQQSTPDDDENSSSNYNVCGVVGATSSAVSKTTAMLTGLRGIPQVSHASTNEDLNEKQDYPYFARTIPDDNFMAEALVRFLYEKLGVRHLFVLVESDPFSKSVLKSLRNAIVDLGWAPTSGGMVNGTFTAATDGETAASGDLFYVEERMVEYISSYNNNREEKNQGLLYEALEGLRSSDVRFVLALTSGPDNNDRLMELAHTLGLANGEHHWWFYETLNLRPHRHPSNSSLAKAYDGVGYIYQSPLKGGERYARFVQESINLKTKLYQDMANNNIASLNSYPLHPSTFSATDLWGRKYLNETDWMQDGYRLEKPLYAYDATILLGLSACRAIMGNTSDITLSGRDWFQQIIYTNFTGVTGNVVLNSTTGTRDGHSVQYAIDNWKAVQDKDGMLSFEATTPYVLRPGGGKIWDTLQPYRFAGNQTIEDLGPHPDLPTVVMREKVTEPWIVAVALALLFVILLATVGFAIWTCVHWNSRVVRASQPHFLLLICLGIAIAILAIVPVTLEHSSFDRTDIICNSIWWLLIVGYGITFSTIFAKTYRINRIIADSIRCRRIQLSIRETLYPVAIIFVFNVVMLSLMTELRPILFEKTETDFDRFGQAIEEYGNCNTTQALPLLLPTISVNLGMICLALFQAWRARHLSTEFAESKYIAIALLISVSVGLFSMPVLALSQGNPNIDTFVNTIINSVLAGVTLCFIFVPKIMFHVKSKKGGRSPSRTSMITSMMTSSLAKRFSFRISSDGSSGGRVNPGISINSNNSGAQGGAPPRTIANSNDRGAPSRATSRRLRQRLTRQAGVREFGERILTMKTPEELASEISSLQKANTTLKLENSMLFQRLQQITKGDDSEIFDSEVFESRISTKALTNESRTNDNDDDDDNSMDSDVSYEFQSASSEATTEEESSGPKIRRRQRSSRMSFLSELSQHFDSRVRNKPSAAESVTSETSV